MGRRVSLSWGRLRLPRWVASLEAAIKEGGFLTVLLLRLTPLPVAASSMLLGSMRKVDPRTHAAATAVGFPRLILNVYLGAQMHEAMQERKEEEWLRRGVHACGVAAAAIAIGIIRKVPKANLIICSSMIARW